MADVTILLVEDDKVQARITKEFLDSAGYKVIIAENGRSAIKAAKTQSIDLIVLDLVLPDIGGNEVARWLKVNEDTRGLPIIMLTSRSTTMEKVEGLKAGADDYLPKPYNEIELITRIYACLRTKALQDELRQKNRELEEALSKVEVLAITDPMTGLFNRRHFETIVEAEFNRTVRYETPTSCLMIDVDHFKNINDTYGHRTGDIVLKELAEIVKDCLRKVDTMARWGGEEFIVLLPRTAKDSATRVASRILIEVSTHQFTDIDRQVTVSIGIASVPESSLDTFEKFINAADLALYEAKSKGRNRVAVAKGDLPQGSGG
jgi:two-component system cell cycle response regulator